MRVGVVEASALDGALLRLNGGFYLSSDHALTTALETWPGEQVSIGARARCFKGGIFKRVYSDSIAHSRPYVSASDLDRSDYWGCRRISAVHGARLRALELRAGVTVVTRSGVNLGWATMIRPDQDGVVGSDDLIRVVARDPDDAGYLGAFLGAAVGRVAIRKFTYATSVKHVEPEHVAQVRVPWLDAATRRRIGGACWRACELRSESQRMIKAATQRVFDAAGVEPLAEGAWRGWGRDHGFVTSARLDSLRAWSYSPRARRLAARVRAVPHATLAELVKPGSLRKGPSFTRVDASPPHAARLIGQRQLFRYVPEGRLVARAGIPRAAFCRPGMTLVAARGTFGESEVFCRAQHVGELASRWLFSGDILRVDAIAGFDGWLYAFLRSRVAFRLLRACATGSKQQDLHPTALARTPVPLASRAEVAAVGEQIARAARLRDEAYRIEDQAKRALEERLLAGRAP